MVDADRFALKSEGGAIRCFVINRYVGYNPLHKRICIFIKRHTVPMIALRPIYIFIGKWEIHSFSAREQEQMRTDKLL